MSHKEISVLFGNIETLLPLNQELLHKLKQVASIEPHAAPMIQQDANVKLAASSTRNHIISVRVEQEKIVKSICIDSKDTGERIVEEVLSRLAWNEERILQLQSDYAYSAILDGITSKKIPHIIRILLLTSPTHRRTM